MSDGRSAGGLRVGRMTDGCWGIESRQGERLKDCFALLCFKIEVMRVGSIRPARMKASRPWRMRVGSMKGVRMRERRMK